MRSSTPPRCRTTHQIAKRYGKELSEERCSFIDAEGPITAGIDGGYLRDWDSKKTNFEVIVGKSVPTDRAAKCFGFVQSYDPKPKRRVCEVLRFFVHSRAAGEVRPTLPRPPPELQLKRGISRHPVQKYSSPLIEYPSFPR